MESLTTAVWLIVILNVLRLALALNQNIRTHFAIKRDAEARKGMAKDSELKFTEIKKMHNAEVEALRGMQ